MTTKQQLEDKVDVIQEDVAQINKTLSDIAVTLAKQEVNLEHHIRRTDLSEENIELLRAEIKPLSRHVVAVETVLKVIGALATGAGLVIGAAKLYLAI